MFSTARFSFRKVQIFHFAKLISGFDVTVITQKKNIHDEEKGPFQNREAFLWLENCSTESGLLSQFK